MLEHQCAQPATKTCIVDRELTAADIQLSFPLEAAAARGGLDQQWPHLMSFLDRIHAMPGYKRALERGGEYDIIS